MTSISSSSTSHSGFQQLSSAMARRNAEQAEQQAKLLRKQADAVQALADRYELKARSLDSQADKAQLKSDSARTSLNLSDSLQKTGERLVEAVNGAVVRESSVYSVRGSNVTTSSNSRETAVGTNIDTSA